MYSVYVCADTNTHTHTHASQKCKVTTATAQADTQIKINYGTKYLEQPPTIVVNIVHVLFFVFFCWSRFVLTTASTRRGARGATYERNSAIHFSTTGKSTQHTKQFNQIKNVLCIYDKRMTLN